MSERLPLEDISSNCKYSVYALCMMTFLIHVNGNVTDNRTIFISRKQTVKRKDDDKNFLRNQYHFEFLWPIFEPFVISSD